jgi:hypothetical protein
MVAYVIVQFETQEASLFLSAFAFPFKSASLNHLFQISWFFQVFSAQIEVGRIPLYIAFFLKNIVQEVSVCYFQLEFALPQQFEESSFNGLPLLEKRKRHV